MSAHHRGLHRRRWEATRRKVLERDGWRCTRCGKAGRLEVDHITPLAADPDQDAYDPAGCQALCRSCHIAKTGGENRRQLTDAEQRWADLVAELS